MRLVRRIFDRDLLYPVLLLLMGIFAQRLKDINSYLDNIGSKIKIFPLKVARPDNNLLFYSTYVTVLYFK